MENWMGAAAGRTSSRPGRERIFEVVTMGSINSRKLKWIGPGPNHLRLIGATRQGHLSGLEVGVMWRWVTRGLVLSVFVLLSASTLVAQATDIIGSRSEERRVGKECRSRWSPYH